MTIFYDEIVAGIVTLFKYCMQRYIYENRLIFSTSVIIQSAARETDLHNSKNILSEQLEASSQAEKINNYTYTFLDNYGPPP